MTLSVALAVAIAASAAWLGRVAGGLRDPQVVSGGLLSELRPREEGDPFYMLLLGTDGRPGETSYRSDTIILARVDPTAGRVALVSVPRDTMVTINGRREKINAAHAIGGAAGVTHAVSELCGVDVSHYAEVSLDGMERLVDAVGGVDVDVEDRVHDPAHFDDDMVLEPGPQHLDGEHAMFYARSRAYPDGDYRRTKHQRTLVSALATKVLSTADPAAAVRLAESLSSMVATDMTPADIASLAMAMRGMGPDAISSCTVPSVTAELDGVSYVVADLPALKRLMDRVDSGLPPDGPTTMGEGLSGS